MLATLTTGISVADVVTAIGAVAAVLVTYRLARGGASAVLSFLGKLK
jgi:hypothetical protein